MNNKLFQLYVFPSNRKFFFTTHCSRSRGNILTVVKHAVDKAEQYAYRDRRVKKRTFRSLWIMRINAAARLNGTTYSRLVNAMLKKNVEIDRKALAEIAVKDPAAFTVIVKSLFE